MATNFKGFVLDPAKCSGLSLEEKRELVREIAQWSDDAPLILSSFSRKELLEIICAEMGKERKYSGFTKLRMIQHLLKLISESTKRKSTDNSLDFSPNKTQTGTKKPRKSEENVQHHTSLNHVDGVSTSKDDVKTLLCPNLACKAVLSLSGFCKRCSCCVCHRYDENKDPSLWLTCDTDFPTDANSCGMSCHLKCAFRHERAGILKNAKYGKLDGRIYCVSCRKVNDLMSTWRKQLLVAKEARRVDVLCLRISICHKILDGTERYKDLHKRVDTAAKKLKKELGPLDRVCEKMGRGIVSRLACGAEVQKLCTSALEAFDAISSQLYTDVICRKELPTCRIRFEESFPTSVVIVLEYDHQLFVEFLGCRIWHRKLSIKKYPEKPTCIVLRPEKKFRICDLNPSTEYICKVALFSCTQVFGAWEAEWATPPSIGMCISVSDEQDAIINGKFLRPLLPCDKTITIDDHTAKLLSPNDINATHLVCSESIPTTPSKIDGRRDFGGPSSNSHVNTEVNDSYEYCVRVIKSLEQDGYLNVDFRVKFLTWFSLKATMQERRVVSAFIDAMANDPPSLAEQVIDAFADEICCERTNL